MSPQLTAGYHNAILKAGMDGFCLVSIEGRILEVNGAYCRMTGYSEEELLSMSVFDVEAQESREETTWRMQSILASGQDRFETRQRRKDGVVIDLEVSVYFLAADSILVAFLRDISERKEAEAALKASEGRFRAIIDASPVPMVGRDSFLKLTFVNRAFVQAFGYEHADIRTATDWRAKAFPDDAYRQWVVDNWQTELARVRRTRATFSPIEVEVVCKDGTKKTALASAAPLSNSYDDHVVVFVDITGRKATEEALKISEAKFRSYIGHAPIGVFVTDATGRFLEVNAAAAKLTGYPEDELLAKSIADLLPPESESVAAGLFQELARTGHALGETSFLRKDGSVGHWMLNAVRVSADRSLSFAMETTERKLALQELQKLRTAVEQSANTIVITDTKGVIEYVNPAFEKSTGYTAAEAHGRTPSVLKSGKQNQAFYGELWAAVSAGRTWRGQFHNRRKDGTLFWESATISPVIDASGKPVYYIAVKEDITERKALEDSLIAALERAEMASTAKSDFLAVMSHELRTPLNGVLGFAELLAMTPLDEEQRDYARTIKTSGDHLLQVVNDILDFSSIEKGHMTLDIETFNLAELIDSSCLACRKMAADKRLLFQYEAAGDIPVQMTGDPRRIRQVLINLLGNAVKFTLKGGITLRLAPLAEGGRRFLAFSVEDTGPGIPAEITGQLFNPFTQADSTLHRPFEGTGLGLAISQRLAKAMGGIITVDSTVGAGTTFTFRLPLADVSREAPPSFRAEDVSGLPAPLDGTKPVLVVEDDKVSSFLAKKMLAALGYRPAFANDGQEAVDAFVPGKFSAILMDMQMPVMDGISATKRIREIEAAAGGRRIPIIALTANVMPGHRETCLAAGMDDFLSKPFTKSELSGKLSRIERD